VGLKPWGQQRTSTDRAAEFPPAVMELASRHVDFATVNVSIAQHEKLRGLQGSLHWPPLWTGVMEGAANSALSSLRSAR